MRVSPREYFQCTVQPTERGVLHHFRVFWQSPRLVSFVKPNVATLTVCVRGTHLFREGIVVKWRLLLCFGLLLLRLSLLRKLA